MPNKPPTHRPPSVPGKVDHRASAHRRGYSRTWRRARLAYLAEHPLCAHCEAQGRVQAAEVVDHVIPHRGDQILFWDVNNWCPLCIPCHNHKTATLDGAFGRAVVNREVASEPGEGATD